MLRLRQNLILILALLLLAGCGWKESPSVTDKTGLRQFEGEKLVVLANKHPWVDLIKPRLSQFTAITGIEVSLEVYPEDQFRIKRMVEMLSGVSRVDVFMMMPGNSLDSYVKEGWSDDLTPLMRNTSLSWPGYDPEDIIVTALNAGIRQGKTYVLPIMMETSLLAYNKLILDQFGLEVPHTMEQLEEAARKVYVESEGQISGITMRGKRGASTSQWIDFVHSFGGDWLDSRGRAALHSPESLEASRFYGRLLRLYGPSSAPSNDWYGSTSLFMQGRAAMIYDANVFKSNYENSQVSQVVGKVGYAMIPRGPAGAVPHASIWGLSLNSGSSRKEAAWYFIQWATGRDIALQGLRKGIPAARRSAWEDLAESSEGLSREWIDASLLSYDSAVTNWNPPVLDINRARESVSTLITASILNDSLTESAFKASELLNRQLKEEREEKE